MLFAVICIDHLLKQHDLTTQTIATFYWKKKTLADSVSME